jgi:D-arginine dehydrogenase
VRVVVIGGGIAGASAAYELAAEADVTVLEREATCDYHSTGRSAALFTECYGDAVVRRLALGSRSFFESPPEGFEGDLVKPRSLLFIGTEAQSEATAASLGDYRSMVPTVRPVPADEVVALCPIVDDGQIVSGILEPGAMDIDVHAVHTGFLHGIRRRGGTVITTAGVTDLERSGGAWRVSTGDQVYDADVVVNAAGAWCDVVGEMAGAAPIGLVPKRRTAFTFAAPEGHQSWPMVIDVEETFYFRPEGPQLLASPCDETPMEPHDVRHREEDVALGIERIQAVTTMAIRTVEHAWAGLRSFVADKRPVNGWDPRLEDFYWLAGQGGFGIKTSPAMARFAAGMILQGEPPGDLVARGLSVEDLAVERLRAQDATQSG